MIIPLVMLQTLFVQMPSGATYKAVDDVPAGTCVMSGEEQLVFEATNFNVCNEVVLEPGCYRAELRGGVGGKNELCSDVVDFDSGNVGAALFSLPEKSSVYVLRGGDGNPGEVNTINGYAGTVGGGASGVDSILVVGNRVWRASGGNGKTCVGVDGGFLNVNCLSYHTVVRNGNGVGGNYNLIGHINGYRAYSTNGTFYIFGVGGGGGSGYVGTGGAKWSFSTSFIKEGEFVNAGTDGDDTSGGNGGDISVCATVECTDTVTGVGGRGGKNVYFNCAGQSAVSYGGGGGGASFYTLHYNNNDAIDGGDGGSGSTGTSDVSFVRIYKM